MKTRLGFAGYIFVAWLTFGYTSTLWGEHIAGADKAVRWGTPESLAASALWPLYWFTWSAMYVFSNDQ